METTIMGYIGVILGLYWGNNLPCLDGRGVSRPRGGARTPRISRLHAPGHQGKFGLSNPKQLQVTSTEGLV